MLSDATILKHIARQPKRSAGFKQLVRELGLHGDARGELDAQLQKLVAAGELIQLNSDRYALPQAGSRQESGRRTPHHAPRRLRLRHPRCEFVECVSQVAPRGRHLHRAPRDRQCHARRSRAGRHHRRSSRWPRRRPHRAPGGASASHRGRDFSLRPPPQFREADRQQDHDGYRDPGGDGVSGSWRSVATPESRKSARHRWCCKENPSTACSATKLRAAHNGMISKA